MHTKIAAEQIEVPCVLMRGGTSKALFFHEADIPAAGPERDRFLKRVMGTPDALQIDGLGGSRLVTSKAAIIRRSVRPGIDVDYTFAQIDVERDLMGYDGNCGNISSAVGPFAIDEGLVDVMEPVTTVRIYNTNTDKVLVSQVQVKNGKARVNGTSEVPGVPGSGAEILMDYSGTVGSRTGKLLPTGSVSDLIVLEDGRCIEVSVVDTANPCVFISAVSLGISANETPDAISADQTLIETIGEIQGKVGQRVGFYKAWNDFHLPGLPLAVILASPAEFTDVDGTRWPSGSMDLRARLVFLGKCHDSMAGTGSLCMAAASRVEGSVVNKLMERAALLTQTLRIGHPLGVMDVKVVARAATSPAETTFTALGLTRTARRLMAGNVYVPNPFA